MDAGVAEKVRRTRVVAAAKGDLRHIVIDTFYNSTEFRTLIGNIVLCGCIGCC
jgi:hypothetical protein